MVLSLYNTLTRKKERFEPIDPQNVRMYVCGPTVYDFAHIGNARPVIVFDVLFRLLRHIYGESRVTYVRNITDVDDKINARAAERYPDLAPELGIRKLTEETAAQFHKDIAALGVLPPTVEPRATEHIAQMVELCDALIANGHAYVAADHVLFDVSSMPDYGRLSNRSLEEMEAGARVEVAPYKKGPMDFVLWKPSKPGEPAWSSPGGIAAKGRPGWHIECSAMAGKHLGKVFDIHGGGIDLTFPHHENEIAQSRCAHETPVMANVWMHNGFLQVEGEKMSKSLGNFITINELLDSPKFGGRRWPGEVLRYAMLMTHYREPINWSVDRLNEAHRELSSLIISIIKMVEEPYPVETEGVEPDAHVIEALSDDLNTPLARTRIQALRALAEKDDLFAKKALAKTLNWLGVYRPAYHVAYDAFGTFASGTEASGGRARGDLLSKYRLAFHDARAIVLNHYDWNTKDAQLREKSRAAVERIINDSFPEMRTDGVAFELDEHCDVRLIPNSSDAELPEGKIKELITARLEARKRKDFKESDRIRDELAAMGIALKDSKNKETGEIETTWEVMR